MLELVIETNRMVIGKDNVHFGVRNPHCFNGVLDSRVSLERIKSRVLSVSAPQQLGQSSEVTKPRRKLFLFTICPHLSSRFSAHSISFRRLFAGDTDNV